MGVRWGRASGFGKTPTTTVLPLISLLTRFIIRPCSLWQCPFGERLNSELRRGTDVVGILPGRPSTLCLVAAVLAEQHGEWAAMRRYLSLEGLGRARLSDIDGNADNPAEEVPTALGLLSAYHHQRGSRGDRVIHHPTRRDPNRMSAARLGDPTRG